MNEFFQKFVEEQQKDDRMYEPVQLNIRIFIWLRLIFTKKHGCLS